jgi:hypothetical protein
MGAARNSSGPNGRDGREAHRPRRRRVGDQIQFTCDRHHRVADLGADGAIYILCRCKQLIEICRDDVEGPDYGGEPK